jgi:hypothetical protein
VIPGTQFGRVAQVRVLPVVGAPMLINGAAGDVANPFGHALRVRFKVEKTATPEPQRATIHLHNLAPVTRGLLAQYAHRPQGVDAAGLTIDKRVFRGTVVELLAGYDLAANLGVLFRGDLATCRSRKVGTDWITTLELGDSEAALTQAECDQSFMPGATALEVVTYAVSVLGLALAPAPIPPALPAYVLTRGFIALGKARETIDAILAGVAPDLFQLGPIAGFVANAGALWDAFTGEAPLSRPIEWWVDDGLVYLMQRAGTLPGPPLQLSTLGKAGTIRLLARPERLEGGAAEARCLLSPAVRLGWPVALTSAELVGAYRVDGVTHEGDNRGGDFTTTAHLRPSIPT